MKSMLRNLIKRAVVTLAGNDDTQVPVQQVTHNGKVADAEIISPYGLHANLSAQDDTLCVLWTIEGHEDYRVAMGYTPTLRPKGLAEGEVVLYHPLTQSRVHFRNNGDVDIQINDGSEDQTGGNSNITITKDLNVIIGGDANVTVAGAATIGVTGDATVDVGGNATVDVAGTADVDVTGNTTLKTAQFDIDSPKTNLGTGGAQIARLGDSVMVTVSSGSSAGPAFGTITAGGINTSI